MDAPSHALAWRGWLAAGGLAAFWLWEQWRPFKPWVDPRLKRYARNIFLSLANKFILEATLSAAVVAETVWLQKRGWGLMSLLALPPALAGASTLLFLDLATYLWHRAYHEVPVMWRLHRVHHTDRDLDVTSASRFHVAEILLSTAYRMAILPLWGPPFEAVAVYEATLLLFAQMQHSNVALPGDWDRRLRPFIVTPDMHRVHHSVVKEETNSNYSSIFSWWDRLFRTYKVEGIDQAALRIGIAEYSRPEDVTLGKLLLMPAAGPCGTELPG